MSTTYCTGPIKLITYLNIHRIFNLLNIHRCYIILNIHRSYIITYLNIHRCIFVLFLKSPISFLHSYNYIAMKSRNLENTHFSTIIPVIESYFLSSFLLSMSPIYLHFHIWIFTDSLTFFISVLGLYFLYF